MNKQLIVKSSNLQLVAMLATAGYPYRFVAAEGNYLFEDTGDIDLMVEDFEKGVQGITDCKALLTTYGKLLAQTGGSAAPGPLDDFVPSKYPMPVTSKSFAILALWEMFGIEVTLTPNFDGKVEGVVRDNGKGKWLMMRFKNDQIVGNLSEYERALYAVRVKLKAAQRPQAQLPTSLSSRDESEAA